MSCEVMTRRGERLGVHESDNRWVVPHNLFLLKRYECHLCVEAVSTLRVFKYIYKHLYKCYDRALIRFWEEEDGVINESWTRDTCRAQTPPGTCTESPGRCSSPHGTT